MAGSNVFGRNESAVLNSGTFKEFAGAQGEKTMTVQGAVQRTAILLAIVAASAAWSWGSLSGDTSGGAPAVWGLLAAGLAFIVGLITALNKSAAPITAPLYALLEGSVLGAISAVFEAQYPGIVIQAVLLTFGTLLGLLVVYKASGFKVTAGFRTGVLAATLAIVVVYAAEIVMHLLGIHTVPYLHQTGLLGIGLSVVVVCIAALNLVLDFDLIESGAEAGAPKYMEWYSAFGLMVTLIWLYLEILKLLIQLAASSDDR